MVPREGFPRSALKPFLRGGEKPLVRPVRIALLLAGSYVVLCAAYIQVSGRLAARAAASIEDLERLEALKGTAFVVVTGVLLFVVTWALLRRVAEQERGLARQRSLLAASERRSAAATFAASAAHDINNVLAVAGGHVSRIAGTSALGPRERESTQRLESAIVEISKLADHLLRLGRLGAGGRVEEVDLRRVIGESVEFARTHRRVRHCEVTARLPEEEARAEADASSVVQCLLNLIINAADAAGPGGRIEVRLGDAGAGPVMEVHDDGPGVPVSDRRRIFEPFYTTKEEGSGLGLVSVKVCAEDHGGRIDVLESDLGGACFRLALPRRRPAPPPAGNPAPATPVAG